MRWWIILVVMSLASALLAGDRGVAAPAYKPEGEMRYALYVTISPAWFDPAEVATAGLTPFWFCYALHDAMLQAHAGQSHGPQSGRVLDSEPGPARLRV